MNTLEFVGLRDRVKQLEKLHDKLVGEIARLQALVEAHLPHLAKPEKAKPAR